MAMSLKVIVPPHPLIKHWLSILREKNTPNILYSTGYEQLGKWLTYEALRNWLPYKKEIVNTDNGDADGFFINNDYPIKAPLINDKRLFEDESLNSDIGKIFTPIFYISSYLEI